MTLTVDVISDVICPWCYIGKRRLEKAVAALAGDTRCGCDGTRFNSTRRCPRAGWSGKAYRTAKFGSWERSLALDAQVAAAGPTRVPSPSTASCDTPNTLDAHRLIWLAGKEGVQDVVVEVVFRAYFAEGRDISETTVLLDVVAGAPA